PTTRIDTRLRLLPAADVILKPWSIVHFHHGAGHFIAHVVPLDNAAIQAGHSCYAQMVFDTPICAVPGDRFILRDAQALHTLGGGTVLDPYAPSRRRRSADRMRYLGALERMNSGAGLATLLAEAPYGVRRSELIRLTGQPLPELPVGAIPVDCGRE